LKRQGRFEIFAEKTAKGVVKIGKSRRYRWRLLAGNGEIVAASEGYHNKRDCERIVARLGQIVMDASRKIVYLDGVSPSRDTSKYRNPLGGRISKT